MVLNIKCNTTFDGGSSRNVGSVLLYDCNVEVNIGCVIPFHSYDIDCREKWHKQCNYELEENIW